MIHVNVNRFCELLLFKILQAKEILKIMEYLEYLEYQ